MSVGSSYAVPVLKQPNHFSCRLKQLIEFACCSASMPIFLPKAVSIRCNVNNGNLKKKKIIIKGIFRKVRIKKISNEKAPTFFAHSRFLN